MNLLSAQSILILTIALLVYSVNLTAARVQHTSDAIVVEG